MLNIKKFHKKKYIYRKPKTKYRNSFYIKATELIKLLNMNMGQIDKLIANSNMPISKYHKGIDLNENYYIFFIEQLISNYFLSNDIV